MYADFFSFRELPFNNTPDPRFFFATPDHEEGLASLIYAVKERKGFVLLTGEVGTGKTLVTRMMLRHFGTHVSFANISHGIQTPAELMESICTEFELDFEPDASATQLIRLLHDFLLGQFAQDIPVVLVLDEAQNLPIQAFEQLRMIGNLEADDAKLLQIAIVGQPELQRRFLSPKLRQLRQRIFRSYHLAALSSEVTERYIHHRLSVVTDSKEEIFNADAISKIYRVSQGLPRIINTICDNALLSAYSAGKRKIDGPFVESVVSQMMIHGENVQEPSPMRSPAPARPAKVKRAVKIEPVPSVSSRETSIAPAPMNPVPRRRVHLAREDAAVAQAARVVHDELSNWNESVDKQKRGPLGNGAQPDQLMVELAHERKTIQALRDSLKDMIQTVTQVTARAETASRTGQHRDTQMRKASETIRELVRDLRALLERARETTDDVVTVERGARKTCGRLGAQMNRAGQLIEELSRLSNQSAPTLRRASPAPVRSEIAAAPPPTIGKRMVTRSENNTAPDTQPKPVAELLRSARASLTDLRSLASTGRSTGYVPPQDIGPKAASTKRLANRVEEMLGMIDSNDATPPQEPVSVGN